ncbi:1-aminocyclopropane-1-carboxylate deaminase [Actinomadura sp. NBRC 104425]|uniref:2-oxoglutarate and iron-dependent oxygenase domain-containing protein n=1 Tax=Actinomadura sp. NBRC 104425 TaxID=3032204 RepID=UPI0024A1DC2F|nr:2-oxoglutarate and iron-dependent oxygenase domain-containing protein [Actinomadura sp. NBRC 104425]GLZ10976.1 1-aminocyclopropane-1-carboxylate deaminase [Actinomadura sp. NBRC 104425]
MLTTFLLPASVGGEPSDVRLGREMIRAWRRDGVVQVAVDPVQAQRTVTAITAARRFFSMPLEYKARHVSPLSYSGYVACEDGGAEVFTVCKDVPEGDIRVRERWPCHGPVPWPDLEYRLAMRAFMDELGGIGDRLLRLVALGLGLPCADGLTRLTADGWHHMRALRLPARAGGGPVAHPVHGLLVMAALDETGGLYVRRPMDGRGEALSFVRPEPHTLAVFPGEVMGFLTGSALPSTWHRVASAERDRYALTYFHEPSFEAELRPLKGGGRLHYGTHLTKTFMRSYPEREATRRIREDGRLEVLGRLRDAASVP